MFFTRHRGSKHLRARSSSGRFAGKPSLKDMGWTACIKCGKFFRAFEEESDGTFISRTKTTHCPYCGERTG